MKKSLLTLAVKTARSKLPNHPEYHNFIHYTFVIQNNQIIEWATNSSKCPPLHYGYHRRLVDAEYSPKTHSEIAAYKKARGLLNHNRSFSIINIRLNKAGTLRLSKPCICCLQIMSVLGCHQAYYSSEVGFLRINL